MLRALARDPAQRFASALELQGALEDFAHENRLRVSALVLAKLMSSMFPARLEEWHAAKSQGAFFVEQHVVRTLIEKTPDPNDPAARAHIKAAQHALAAADASQSGSRIPMPIGFAVPAGGTLVTSSTIARPVEITERVVVPRTVGPEAAQPTMIIQIAAPKPPRRAGRAVLGALVLAGAAAAGVFVATRGSAQLAGATAAPTESTQTAATPPAQTPAPAPTPAAPPPVAVQAAPPTPAPASDPGSAAPVEPAPAAVEPPVAVKKAAHPRPHFRPKPAKEQTWNADSPFMPVRSH